MQFQINEETSSEEVLKVIKELELVAKAKKENEEAIKFPVKLGGRYHVVMPDGQIQSWVFDDAIIDWQLNSMGSVFATKEEALMQVETLKVIQELKQCKGYRPFEVGSVNYSLYYEFNEDGLGVWNMQITMGMGFGGIIFDSKDSITEAINKVGEQRIINAMLWYYCKQVNL
jgi:hypothetical protein